MILGLLLACEPAPLPEAASLVTRESPTGPDMVRIPGAVVRHGMKAGTVFVIGPPGGPPPGGGPAGAPPGGPGGPGGPPPGQAGPPPGGTQGAPPGGHPVPAQGGAPGGAPGGPSAPPGSPSAGGGALPDLGATSATKHGLTKADPDPLEAREVEVGDFWIDLTETTHAEYARFIEATGYRPPFVDEPWAMDGYSWVGGEPPAGLDDHPVVLVNWYDARAYCAWAGKRLPTEPEWQLAVLGPSEQERNYPWGAELGEGHYNHGRMIDPNYDDSDGWARTSPVTAFPTGRSWAGLYDGFGNAWEWTNDWRVQDWEKVSGERRGGRLVDPHTEGLALYAAVRGGSFFFDLGPNPAGERNAFIAELRRKSSGFRCAADAD